MLYLGHSSHSPRSLNDNTLICLKGARSLDCSILFILNNPQSDNNTAIVLRLWISFSVMVFRAYALGTLGMGCVGDKTSPCTPSVATGTSSIGNTGFPVSLSNTKTYPCLVICATASKFLPSLLMVTRFGGAGRSRSHTS